VALLYNESDDTEQSTDDAIADLDKAYKSYIGPAAPYHDAYVTYNNRPVIFIFPKSGKTTGTECVNMSATGSTASAFYTRTIPVNPPMLSTASTSGCIPEKVGRPMAADWGKQHLEDFYKRMKEKISAEDSRTWGVARI